MARNFHRPRGRGQRRLTDWASTAPQTVFTALAAATAILDSTFTTAVAQPETLIRCVGNLTVETDQKAADETPFGAFGVCVVSDQAAAIGVTAIPTPYTDAGSDLWLLHQFWTASIKAGSNVAFASLSQSYELSSKAMRKVSDDETVCLVIENGAAAFGAIYRLDMRLLSKVA